MGEFNYAKGIITAVKDIIRKPILVLPFAGMFVISIFYFILTAGLLPESYIYSESPAMNMEESMLVFGVAVIWMLILIVFFAVILAAFRMYTKGVKLTFANRWKKGLKMYFKLLLLIVYKGLVFAIPLIVLSFIFGIIIYFNPGFTSAAEIIMLIIYLIYVVCAFTFMIFSEMIVSEENKSANKALAEAYKLFKFNKAHAILSATAVITLLLAVFLIIKLIAMLLLSLGSNQIIAAIYTVFIILLLIVSFGASGLFLFRAYNVNASGIKSSEKQNKNTEPKISAEPAAPVAKKAKSKPRTKKKK